MYCTGMSRDRCRMSQYPSIGSTTFSHGDERMVMSHQIAACSHSLDSDVFEETLARNRISSHPTDQTHDVLTFLGGPRY
jgi:hypothetical protein